jgi:glycosyltransferase involved in cell wall biosynthesis/CBS domain-containing protein
MVESDVYFKILFGLPVLSGTNLNTPTINPEKRISDLIDVLILNNIGAIVAVENEKSIGIVTEKDILEKVLNKERNLEKTLVRDIMSSPVISIDSAKPVKVAIDLLREHKIRRLAVTENERFIGLTTERRLLNIAHSVYVENTQDIVQINGLPEKPIVTYLSSYPPRECGIATFTYDLVNSIDKLNALSTPIITAINDRGSYYDYPPQVKIQIDRDEHDSYYNAAERINKSGISALNLQHEYGLFGGIWGDYLIDFLEEVKKPVITTLHTILENPPPDAYRVMKDIIRLSHRIVVIARVGSRILEQTYETLPDKVRHIPHGCPNVPFVNSNTVKPFLGFKDRLIFATFGLISRGKGIEYAIQSLPDIVTEHPDILYLVIGETHPEVRKHEGESYRQSLIDLVESLGLTNNVRFVNRFLSKNELIRFLQATDIYILPYPNPEQISSGTMMYALCTGKAIVTTPFLHAQEVISQEAAVASEFKDSKSIAQSVNSILDSPEQRRILETSAYDYSRGMIWPNVAMRYVNLFYKSTGI